MKGDTMTTETTTQHPLAALYSPPFDDHMRQAFSLDLDGVPHAVATDGRILLAVAGASDLPAADAEWDRKFRHVLAMPVDDAVPPLTPLLTSVEVLRAWAGDVVVPPVRQCGQCQGSGTCNRCDCDTEHDCGYCGGVGERRGIRVERPGLLLDALVDLDRLSRLTSLVSGQCRCELVMSGTGTPNSTIPTRTLRLSGEGWVGFLATMAAAQGKVTRFGDAGHE